MPTFMTRVELHGADEADYQNLHRYMQEQKFSRFITAGDGTRWQLPTAEYQSFGELTVDQVRDLARGCAAKTGRSHWVLVCEYTSASWLSRRI